MENQNELLKKLQHIHDVKCPKCGTKASFVVKSFNPPSYTSNTCGHSEIKQLINEREQILTSNVAPELVKLNIRKPNFGD